MESRQTLYDFRGDPIEPEPDEIAITRKAWMNRYGGFDENPDDVISRKGAQAIIEYERDTHLKAQLYTRKQNLISKGWKIEADSADLLGQEKADFVKWNLEEWIGNFMADLLGMLDALGKGFSISEKVWERVGTGSWQGKWALKGIHKKPFANIKFKRDEYGHVRSVINTIDNNKAMSYQKFVHVIFGEDDENPYGEGLTSLSAFWIWLKKNQAKFWAIFNEKFSMPTIIAKTPRGANSEQKTKIENFIKNFQSEAGFRIPENFIIEFLEAARKGDVTYDNFIERCNKEISKVVLGQTLSSEEGKRGQGSYALGQAHLSILDIYVFFDNILLSAVINQQIVKELIDYNWLDGRYPKFQFNEEINWAVFSQAVANLTSAGIQVPANWVLRKMNIPIAGDGEPVTKSQSNQKSKGIDNAATKPAFAGWDFEADENFEGDDPLAFGAYSTAYPRKLTYFEERGNLKAIDKGMQKIEADMMTRGAEAIDKVFASVQKQIEKKVTPGLPVGSEALPKFAVNMSELKSVLETAGILAHLFGNSMASRELQKAGLDIPVLTRFADIPEDIYTPEEALEWMQSLGKVTKKQWLQLSKFYQDRAFFAAGLEKQKIETLFNTVLLGLDQGWTLQTFGAAVAKEKVKYTGIVYGKDMTNKPMQANHLETIFRAWMGKAYRSGKNAVYNDPDVGNFVWGYTYSAILDSRTRPEHAKLDGVTRAKEDAFWQKYDPPWDYGCRCDKFAVTKIDLAKKRTEPTSDRKMPSLNPTSGW